MRESGIGEATDSKEEQEGEEKKVEKDARRRKRWVKDLDLMQKKNTK